VFGRFAELSEDKMRYGMPADGAGCNLLAQVINLRVS